MEQFEKMLSLAKSALNSVSCGDKTQVIVLLCEGGREYVAVIDDATTEYKFSEKQLLGKLEEDNCTTVNKIVCEWAQGGLDVPSYDFRKMLCDLDGKNADTVMLLEGKDQLITKTVRQTMPPKTI